MFWVAQDAAQLVRDMLRKLVEDRKRIQFEVPDKWTPAAGPVVTVVSDGTPVSSRGWTREIVRVTVHGSTAVQVRKIMAAIDAALITPTRGSWGFAISPGTGIIVTKDSRLGGWVSSATYNVATSRKRTP